MSICELLVGEEQSVKRVYGVAAGIVTNNKDPNKLGQVKVRFPWLSDKNESNWVRVATLMSGKQMGSFFLPEVGDEVLVAFENGDINAPYVIGCLWNGKTKPPETNKDGKNNIRTFKSRSGHEIRFDDTKQKEKLEIKTKSGHYILLDDTSSKGNIAIQTKTGHKFVMDDKSGKEKIGIQSKSGHKFLLDDASGKGKIALQSKAGHQIVLNDASGQEKIEIKDKTGSNKITIDSVQKAVNIESAMQLKIKAKMIDIEAGMALKIKSGAMLELKGAMVKIN
ncbi:MAG: phage tail protein [Candidatus Aminicenantes bacterium]|nr:phage tail protein [Candidatus Aminicenantes bacterium]NIM81874.1 phage tail protein [Candidatus Aminicenantes bacterium]NIN21251.1 phage tail protein [Candidatus Aminicenantes bacterium]NIN45072.1 phage tail protein [Candidatus Aminicenantes bacterium]NIN87889.1 phage tail protein [Candidatus Aminicenantes bacterium]